MHTRRSQIPLMLAVAVAAIAGIGATSAKADPWGCGPRYYSSAYAYRAGGCYVPPPVYYYRPYVRTYCEPVPYYRSYYAPAPYYRPGGFGFSFNYSHGGGYRRSHRDCD